MEQDPIAEENEFRSIENKKTIIGCTLDASYKFLTKYRASLYFGYTSRDLELFLQMNMAKIFLVVGFSPMSFRGWNFTPGIFHDSS